MGIDPPRDAAQRPTLDLKCGNCYFSNPLVLVRFSRNLTKILGNLISIYSNLFYLFRYF